MRETRAYVGWSQRATRHSPLRYTYTHTRTRHIYNTSSISIYIAAQCPCICVFAISPGRLLMSNGVATTTKTVSPRAFTLHKFTKALIVRRCVAATTTTAAADHRAGDRDGAPENPRAKIGRRPRVTDRPGVSTPVTAYHVPSVSERPTALARRHERTSASRLTRVSFKSRRCRVRLSSL